MFQCGNCGELVERGQPANKIVKTHRQVVYNNVVKTRKQEKRYGVPKGETWQTEGREIVEEIDVCPKCYIGLTGRKPNLKQEVRPPREHPKRKVNRKGYKRTERRDERRRPDVKVINKLPIIK